MNSFYIYGAGLFGQKLKNSLGGLESYCLGVIDDRKRDLERLILGVEDCSEENRAMDLWLGVFNPEVSFEELKERLCNAGWTGKIYFPQDYLSWVPQMETFWLSLEESYSEKEKEILRGLFSDEQSRTLDYAIEQWRYGSSDNRGEIISGTFEDQYNPEGLNMIPESLSVIDCGAYKGDSIEVLTQYNADVYWGFEPDPLNFGELIRNVKKVNAKAYIYECGVWSQNECLSFKSNDSAGSICTSGTISIPCYSLDSFNFESTIGYIKMDIEGAEYQALVGAEKTIKKNKPNLAISVYHRRDDVYRILELVQSWGLPFESYLRVHGQNTFDTVLYIKMKKDKA